MLGQYPGRTPPPLAEHIFCSLWVGILGVVISLRRSVDCMAAKQIKLKKEFIYYTSYTV